MNLSLVSPHYYKINIKGLDLQAYHLINAGNFSYNIGTAITYLIRAGKKQNNSIKNDVTKAINHIAYEQQKLTDYPHHYSAPAEIVIDGIVITANDLSELVGSPSRLALEKLITTCNSLDEHLAKIELAGHLLVDLLQQTERKSTCSI